MSRLKEFAFNGLKSGLKTHVVSAKNVVIGNVKSGVKGGISKVDPFAENIDKNSVCDTGAESIRLANQSFRGVKKGIEGVKTAERTLKTSVRTVKTTARAVKFTGKAVYHVAVGTAKAVVATAKFIANMASHAVALAMNPTVAVAVAFLLIIAMSSSMLVMILGGADGNNRAVAGATGFANSTQTVQEVYQMGVGYFNTAVSNQQSGFNATIASIPLNPTLSYSDLVYMETRYWDRAGMNYLTGFPGNSQKEMLINAWDFTLTADEIIAIAYVLLQKEANSSYGTSGQIYSVTLTQATIDSVVARAVYYSNTQYYGYSCPNLDCEGGV
jgi:hypothetical protein